jgi:NADH-quinone oxidoreductase subunit A
MNCPVALFIILPPAVFLLIFVFLLILSFFTEKIAYKNPDNPAGKTKAYACGEDVKEHRIRPNYSEFFPFAFFFTIMHVIVLVIATSPDKITDSLAAAMLFVVVAFLSILIIFRSERND